MSRLGSASFGGGSLGLLLCCVIFLSFFQGFGHGCLFLCALLLEVREIFHFLERGFLVSTCGEHVPQAKMHSRSFLLQGGFQLAQAVEVLTSNGIFNVGYEGVIGAHFAEELN